MKSLGMFMFFFISVHLFKMLSIARALEKIDCNISYYFRYVDDILLSAPSDQISKLLDVFNSLNSRLQFAVEYENNRKLSFVDLMLEVNDNVILVNWSHKETFSGRLLSYYSNHQIHHKVGAICNFVDRAISLFHPKF